VPSEATDNTASPAQFSVSSARTGAGEVTVKVAGEVDLLTSKELDAVFVQVMAEAADTVVVEMSGVEFCDSTGLTMLVKLNSECIAANRDFRIVPSRTVRKVIEITGLAPVLPLTDG
jgi:anti-sigma B factor antagonist